MRNIAGESCTIRYDILEDFGFDIYMKGLSSGYQCLPAASTNNCQENNKIVGDHTNLMFSLRPSYIEKDCSSFINLRMCSVRPIIA